MPSTVTRAPVTPVPSSQRPPNSSVDPPAATGSSTAPPSPAEPAASPTPPAPAEPTPAGGFSSTISPIDDPTATRMATSWRPGCPVALADLRYLSVNYRGFDGSVHQGELVVAASVAADVVDIFGALYAGGYPIESLRLVDDFGGSDDDSMAANNSSAFNCRPVTGGGGFSEHSYGTAIDLNPVQNPYLSGPTVLPEAGRDYAERRPAPGVIEPGGVVVTAFADHGWSWGGDWSGPIDYQHFSVSGR
ncbi:MAG: M15 family metallopeptidase [Nakamurella sp.]